MGALPFLIATGLVPFTAGKDSTSVGPGILRNDLFMRAISVSLTKPTVICEPANPRSFLTVRKKSRSGATATLIFRCRLLTSWLSPAPNVATLIRIFTVFFPLGGKLALGGFGGRVFFRLSTGGIPLSIAA